MSKPIDRSGFEDAILYSNDDYEPYGYVSPQVSDRRDVHDSSSFGSREREIEAAVLRRLESYIGC